MVPRTIGEIVMLRSINDWINGFIAIPITIETTPKGIIKAVTIRQSRSIIA
jgi:hypothetical protein